MNDSTAREAARGTGLILAGSVITQLAEYLYRFAVARGLGPDGFGTFSQARSVLLVLAVLSTLGLNAGVKRFVAKLGEEGRGAEARRVIRDGSWLVAASTLAGAALLWALAGPLGAAFHNPSLVWPLRILAFALPTAVGIDYVARIGEAFRSFRAAVVARQVLDPCLRLVLTVGLLALGGGLTAVMGAYAVSGVIGLLVAIGLVARIERLRALDRGAVSSQAGTLLRFSLPLVFGGVLFDFAERIDILMIGLFRDEAQVGVYAVGSALARALLLLVASTVPVVGTLAAEAVGRGSAEEIAKLHRTVTRWMLFFTAPLGAGLLLFPEEAVTLLFGRQYAEAAATVQVLVLAYLTGVLAGPVGLLLNTMGKTHWTLANMAIRTAINIVLNLLLIPRFGIVGAAWGTVVSLAVASALMLVWLGRMAPIGRSYAGWGRPLLVLCGASALGWGASRLLMAAGVGGAVAPWATGLAGGAVLLATFAVGVKVVPGCLEEGDLALLRLVRARR